MLRKMMMESQKDRVPKYVLRYTMIDFVAKRKTISDPVEWNVKQYGPPIPKTLKKRRNDFIESMRPGDANSHLAKSVSLPGTIIVKLNAAGGREVARYVPPTFEKI